MRKIIISVIIVLIISLCLTAFASDNLTNGIVIEFFNFNGQQIDEVYIDNSINDNQLYYPINATHMKVIVNAKSDLYDISLWVNNENYGYDPYYDISEGDSFYLEVEVFNKKNDVSEEYAFHLIENTQPRSTKIESMSFFIETDIGTIYYPEIYTISDHKNINVVVPNSTFKLHIEYFGCDSYYNFIEVLDNENNIQFGNNDIVSITIGDENNEVIVTNKIDGVSSQYIMNFTKAEELNKNSSISAIEVEYLDDENIYLETRYIECDNDLFDYTIDVPQNAYGLFIVSYPQEYTTKSKCLYYEEEVTGIIQLEENLTIKIESEAEDASTSTYNVSFKKIEDSTIETELSSKASTSITNNRKVIYWIIPLGIVLIIIVLFTIIKKQ